MKQRTLPVNANSVPNETLILQTSKSRFPWPCSNPPVLPSASHVNQKLLLQSHPSRKPLTSPAYPGGTPPTSAAREASTQLSASRIIPRQGPRTSACLDHGLMVFINKARTASSGGRVQTSRQIYTASLDHFRLRSSMFKVPGANSSQSLRKNVSTHSDTQAASVTEPLMHSLNQRNADDSKVYSTDLKTSFKSETKPKEFRELLEAHKRPDFTIRKVQMKNNPTKNGNPVSKLNTLSTTKHNYSKANASAVNPVVFGKNEHVKIVNTNSMQSDINIPENPSNPVSHSEIETKTALSSSCTETMKSPNRSRDDYNNGVSIKNHFAQTKEKSQFLQHNSSKDKVVHEQQAGSLESCSMYSFKRLAKPDTASSHQINNPLEKTNIGDIKSEFKKVAASRQQCKEPVNPLARVKQQPRKKSLPPTERKWVVYRYLRDTDPMSSQYDRTQAVWAHNETAESSSEDIPQMADKDNLNANRDFVSRNKTSMGTRGSSCINVLEKTLSGKEIVKDKRTRDRYDSKPHSHQGSNSNSLSGYDTKSDSMHDLDTHSKAEVESPQMVQEGKLQGCTSNPATRSSALLSNITSSSSTKKDYSQTELQHSLSREVIGGLDDSVKRKHNSQQTYIERHRTSKQLSLSLGQSTELQDLGNQLLKNHTTQMPAQEEATESPPLQNPLLPTMSYLRSSNSHFYKDTLRQLRSARTLSTVIQQAMSHINQHNLKHINLVSAETVARNNMSDILDYFWSYQGMGRQILGMTSEETITNSRRQLKQSFEPRIKKVSPPLYSKLKNNVDSCEGLPLETNPSSSKQFQLVLKIPCAESDVDNMQDV